MAVQTMVRIVGNPDIYRNPLRTQWCPVARPAFTYESICAAPDAVLACTETFVKAVRNLLLTITQSGGLYFSCRIPHYIHPNTEEARFYIYKDVLSAENMYQRDVYLETLGEEEYSPWDARYEILLGDLLNPPVITKEVLFAAKETR